MVLPEKIYIEKCDAILDLYSNRESDDEIEYTRIDVFLDKAEKFFENNLTEEDCKFGSSEWTEVKTDYESIDSFIRAFRNYMKKE